MFWVFSLDQLTSLRLLDLQSLFPGCLELLHVFVQVAVLEDLVETCPLLQTVSDPLDSPVSEGVKVKKRGLR